MTILVEKLILCDGGAECPSGEPGNNDGVKSGISSARVRENATANGWVSHGKKDYCEACAKRLGYAD